MECCSILYADETLACFLQDQGAFLSEFETKALQVATQTPQPAEPEVVEKVVEVIKVSLNLFIYRGLRRLVVVVI